jgi:hypothetical protein
MVVGLGGVKYDSGDNESSLSIHVSLLWAILMFI